MHQPSQPRTCRCRLHMTGPGRIRVSIGTAVRPGPTAACRAWNAMCSTPLSVPASGSHTPRAATTSSCLSNDSVLGSIVPEVSESVHELAVRDVAGPLDAVCQDRNEGIVDGRALVGPSLVANHDLAGREAFLGSSDEEVAVRLADLHHEARLAEPPIVLALVVHVTDGVRDSRNRQPSFQEQTKIAQVVERAEVHLFLARVVLSVGRIVVQESAAPPKAEVLPVVLVEGRLRRVAVRLRRIEVRLYRRIGRCRRRRGRLLGRRRLGRGRRLGLGLRQRGAGEQHQCQQASQNGHSLHDCLLHAPATADGYRLGERSLRSRAMLPQQQAGPGGRCTAI